MEAASFFVAVQSKPLRAVPLDFLLV